MAGAGQPTARWRQFVNDRPIASLALTGLIATQLGTYFGYVFQAVGLPVLPWPLYNGILGTTFGEGFPVGAEGALGELNGGTSSATAFFEFATSGEAFFVGNALHFVNGIVFAILWGVFFRDGVPLKRSFGGNIQKGLIYGVIMSIISAGLLVPYAYVENQGYGLFLFDGPDGWKLPLAILVWHLIYGYFLGALWNPDETVDTVDTVQRY